MRRLRAGLVVAALCALGSGACDDLRHFTGEWEGEVSPDPNQRHGFAPKTRLRGKVDGVSRTAIALSLTLPGRGGPLPFVPLRHAAGDALGNLTFDGAPLRTYLGLLHPPGEAPYFTVVSLFAEERVDVRLIRGAEESYGVFSLHRVRMP